VPKAALTLNGPVKKWSGVGSSGKAVHRLFCSECGSPIAHEPDAAPGITAIKGGTLDSEIKKGLKPVSITCSTLYSFLKMFGDGKKKEQERKRANHCWWWCL
jgi:hypothetical protein